MRLAASALGPASKRLLCNWHEQVPHQKPEKVLNIALNSIHQLHSWLCPLFVQENSDTSIISQLGTEWRHLCLEWTDKCVKLRKHFPSSRTKGILVNSLDSKCTEHSDHLFRTHAASSSCCWLRENKSFRPSTFMPHFECLVEQRVDRASKWRCQLAHFVMTATASSKEARDDLTSSLGIKLSVNAAGSHSFWEKLGYSSTSKVVKKEFRNEQKSYFNEVGQKLGVIRGQIKSYCWELTY